METDVPRGLIPLYKVSEPTRDRDKPPGRHVPYYCRRKRLNLSTYRRAHVRNLQSTQDLIRRGIADGIVGTQPQSWLHDASVIKSILNDTLAVLSIVLIHRPHHLCIDQAYQLLPAAVADLSKLTPDLICDVHARLMETSRFARPTSPPARHVLRQRRRSSLLATIRSNVARSPRWTMSSITSVRWPRSVSSLSNVLRAYF